MWATEQSAHSYIYVRISRSVTCFESFAFTKLTAAVNHTACEAQYSSSLHSDTNRARCQSRPTDLHPPSFFVIIRVVFVGKVSAGDKIE